MAHQIKNTDNLIQLSKERQAMYEHLNLLTDANNEIQLQQNSANYKIRLENEIDFYLKNSYHLNKKVTE